MDGDVMELLRRLVSIPSVNPAYGDDAAVCGEQRMAEYLGDCLTARGFACGLEGPTRGRPNLVGVAGGAGWRRSLVIEGHLDTVGIAGMSMEPFAGMERGGRLYGRGACDMKGAWAAMLAALTPDRVQAAADAGLRLIIVGAMGEETGNEGARYLVDTGKVRADEAVVLEPTGLRTIHAHKGIAWFRLRLRGRSGHGSAPDRGISAIEGAAAAIGILREELLREAPAYPVLGAPTLNVGRIHGGEGVNVVAGECTMDLDCRIVPGDDADGLRARLERGLATLVDGGLLTAFAVETLQARPPYVTPPDSDLITRLRDSCARVGGPAEVGGTSWYSDAGPLSEVCGATAVFGPGRIEQAHTADEYIAEDEVRRGAEALGVFLEATAARDGGPARG